MSEQSSKARRSADEIVSFLEEDSLSEIASELDRHSGIKLLKRLYAYGVEAEPEVREEAQALLREIAFILGMDEWQDIIGERGLTPIDDARGVLYDLELCEAHENQALIKYEVPRRFSPRANEEIDAMPKVSEECDEQWGEVFTIDDPWSTDLDDAFSIKESQGQYIVGIHISDITTLIAPHGALEKKAERRASTIYCPD